MFYDLKYNIKFCLSQAPKYRSYFLEKLGAIQRLEEERHVVEKLPGDDFLDWVKREYPYKPFVKKSAFYKFIDGWQRHFLNQINLTLKWFEDGKKRIKDIRSEDREYLAGTRAKF